MKEKKTKSKKGRDMTMDITVVIHNKKKGDEKIEAFLEKEAAGWIKFILSKPGVEVLKYLYGEDKSAKLKIVEKPSEDKRGNLSSDTNDGSQL